GSPLFGERNQVEVPLLGGAMCMCTWHFFYNSVSRGNILT
uniref:Uncharacterized protein n=1 Tax=Aegilops tauschii subsp. strangulata TaxID=200361 RepID=A0A453JU53_AEGTS